MARTTVGARIASTDMTLDPAEALASALLLEMMLGSGSREPSPARDLRSFPLDALTARKPSPRCMRLQAPCET